MRSHDQEPSLDNSQGAKVPFFLSDQYQEEYRLLGQEGWDVARAQVYLVSLIPSKEEVARELTPAEIQRLFLLYNFLRSQGEMSVAGQFEECLSAYAYHHFIPKIRSGIEFLFRGQRGIDAEDVAQDAYVHLRERIIAGYDCLFGTTFEGFFASAAYKFARSRRRSERDRKKREKIVGQEVVQSTTRPGIQSVTFSSEELSGDELGGIYGPEFTAILRERRHQLRELMPRLLDKLIESDLLLMQLTMAGMSYADIAAHLGKEINTVKSAFNTLRTKKLPRILEANEDLQLLGRIFEQMEEEGR